jgi:DNA replication protein DnaC
MSAAIPISIGNACARCRGTGVLFAPKGERAQAERCECQISCAECAGSGRRLASRDGAVFAQPCECRATARRVELYNRAGIPRHFGGKGFEAFQPYDASLSDVLRRVQSFAEGYPKFGKGVGLFGQPGSGKTHLLTAALQHLALARGVSCRYVEFTFLCSEIREAFMRNVSALTALAPLAEVEVLAIDEVGKGRASDFERDTLDELISRRYNADRTTLFATNFNASLKREARASDSYLNPAASAREAMLDQHLRERIGERTFSRLAEMTDIVHVVARDRRIPPG